MNHRGPSQLSLTLGSHFGQDVALESAFALIATCRFFEPLGGSAVNFCFRHVYYSALARTAFSVVVDLTESQGLHGPLTPFLGGDYHRQLSAFHLRKLLDITQLCQIGFDSFE